MERLYNFSELVDRSMPGYVSLDLINRQLNDRQGKPVAESAKFATTVVLGNISNIGDHVRIERESFVSDFAFLDNEVVVCESSAIMERAKVFRGSVLLRSTRIGELSVIGAGSIIGPGVEIPQNTQLDVDSVVPSNKTLVAISAFGASKRTVTIHGSDDGPRYSIGCQNSVDWQTIHDRIILGTGTTPGSALHYEGFLSSFNQLGLDVQHQYDSQSRLVEDIRAEAATLRHLATNPS